MLFTFNFKLTSTANYCEFLTPWYMVFSLFQSTRSTLALTDGFGDPEILKQNLQTLLAWVCEIEELMANQKPPSSEFKVVKAQLQEQKVCLQ